ncbi:unnamed protein product, partial [Laminaria digitata]
RRDERQSRTTSEMPGGINLILVGDPVRLRSVGAAPMWTDNSSTAEHTVEGLPAWLGLNAYVELTSIMRQLGPMQADFRRAMLSVAEGPVTPDDCNNLASRMRFAVTPDEARSFNEAVHFFHTKA